MSKPILQIWDEESQKYVPIPAIKGKDAVVGTATATLTVQGWTNRTQTISVPSVTSSSTVIVSPAPASVPAYAAAQVYCSAQGDGTLTFTCDTLPTAELAVNVVILR